MLQFLQTGKMLYVLAAVCALGALSKLVTSSLYKRLIKETGNMALTKNKNLKALKQKTENMFLISHGIRNTGVYIERQIYGFRFMRMSLDSWDNLSVQAMILCFLIGGVAAFASYWYRCDSYYIVLYGTIGILSGLFLVLVDNGANIAVKRQQLADCLADYVENSPHFYKNVERSSESTEPEKKSSAAIKSLNPRPREFGRKGVKAVQEMAVADEKTVLAEEKEDVREQEGHFHIEKAEKDTKKAANAQTERQGGRFSVLSRKKEGVLDEQAGKNSGGGKESAGAKRQNAQKGDELSGNIEYLRESLEQIAASREQTKRTLQEILATEKPGTERARKELKPEDLKLLGELLQEYLT